MMANERRQSGGAGGSPPATSGAGSSAQRAMRKSCRFCRTRKIKCSGDTGGCKACQTRGIECIYDPTATMGRPRKYPRNNEGGRLSISTAGGRMPPTPIGAPPMSPTPSMGPISPTMGHAPGQQWATGWPMNSPRSAPPEMTSWPRPQGPDVGNMYRDVRRPSNGLDLATLADASGWAASGDQAYPRQPPVWSMQGIPPPVRPPSAAMGHPGQAGAGWAAYGMGSGGGVVPATTDRSSIEGQIVALLNQGHNPLKRQREDVSESPTMAAPQVAGPSRIPISSSSDTPDQDVFSRNDLAATFQAFRGKPIGAMAAAHLQFLNSDASASLQEASAFTEDRGSDPAHTRRHYITAFRNLASTSSEGETAGSPGSPVGQPNFNNWNVYAEILTETVQFAAAGEGFPMPAMSRNRFAAMLRSDKGGDFVPPSTPQPDASPLSGLGVDAQLQLFALWHSRSPLGLLINDAIFVAQIQQGFADPALMATIAGSVLAMRELEEADEVPPPARELDPTALFDFAERDLLGREVSIEHPPILLGTVQGLVLLATYRGGTLQTRKSWALLSVAHGLARASVRQAQAQEIDARRRGGVRTVPPELQVIEENLLSCCWLMAFLAAWCFLSSGMPKTSVLDMCDGLPPLPEDMRTSTSYRTRSTTSGIRQSDEPVAFGIEFFSECTRVLVVITRLWSRGVSTVPGADTVGNPSQQPVDIWRKRLYGDPRVKSIGIMGPIISEMFVNEARELWKPRNAAVDPPPRSTMVLPVAQAALGLTQLVPRATTESESPSLAPEAMKSLIHALGIMTDVGLAAIGASQPPSPAVPVTDPKLISVVSSAVMRICSFAFPRAIALLHDTVERASSSTDHYHNLRDMCGQVQRVAESLRLLAASHYPIVSQEDYVRMGQIVTATVALFPLQPASPSSMARSVSMPPQSEGAGRHSPMPPGSPPLRRVRPAPGIVSRTPSAPMPGQGDPAADFLGGRHSSHNLVLQPVLSSLAGISSQVLANAESSQYHSSTPG